MKGRQMNHCLKAFSQSPPPPLLMTDQSITTAPGLIQLPWTIDFWPIATSRMSAWRQISARFSVREWQTVTVPWCLKNIHLLHNYI
jgi:hypothetical protein